MRCFVKKSGKENQRFMIFNVSYYCDKGIIVKRAYKALQQITKESSNGKCVISYIYI